MANNKKYYFYVYVTRHGVYSENSCLHVGIQNIEPKRNGYCDWFSKAVNKDIADKVYEKVEKYNNYGASEEIDARRDIEYWISHFEK